MWECNKEWTENRRYLIAVAAEKYSGMAVIICEITDKSLTETLGPGDMGDQQ